MPSFGPEQLGPIAMRLEEEEEESALKTPLLLPMHSAVGQTKKRPASGKQTSLGRSSEEIQRAPLLPVCFRSLAAPLSTLVRQK